jgi:hypothetical protein
MDPVRVLDGTEAAGGTAASRWVAAFEFTGTDADTTGILNPVTAARSTIEPNKRNNVNISLSLRVGFIGFPISVTNLRDSLGLPTSVDLAAVNRRVQDDDNDGTYINGYAVNLFQSPLPA